MAIVTPTFCNQIGHLATKFLPSEIGILKFCVAHLCAKNGEKHRNEGFVHAFEACESSNLMHFVPFLRLGISGALCLSILYLVDY